jgi:hypothetical protein
MPETAKEWTDNLNALKWRQNQGYVDEELEENVSWDPEEAFKEKRLFIRKDKINNDWIVTLTPEEIKEGGYKWVSSYEFTNQEKETPSVTPEVIPLEIQEETKQVSSQIENDNRMKILEEQVINLIDEVAVVKDIKKNNDAIIKQRSKKEEINIDMSGEALAQKGRSLLEETGDLPLSIVGRGVSRTLDKIETGLSRKGLKMQVDRLKAYYEKPERNKTMFKRAIKALEFEDKTEEEIKDFIRTAEANDFNM